MSTATTPGPALECLDCGNCSPEAAPRDFDPCPQCGSGETRPVRLVGCDLGDACGEDEHDFGLGMHVVGAES